MTLHSMRCPLRQCAFWQSREPAMDPAAGSKTRQKNGRGVRTVFVALAATADLEPRLSDRADATAVRARAAALGASDARVGFEELGEFEVVAPRARKLERSTVTSAICCGVRPRGEEQLRDTEVVSVPLSRVRPVESGKEGGVSTNDLIGLSTNAKKKLDEAAATDRRRRNQRAPLLDFARRVRVVGIVVQKKLTAPHSQITKALIGKLSCTSEKIQHGGRSSAYIVSDRNVPSGINKRLHLRAARRAARRRVHLRDAHQKFCMGEFGNRELPAAALGRGLAARHHAPIPARQLLQLWPQPNHSSMAA